MEKGFATKCIYGSGKKAGLDETGAVSYPIYQTATFCHPRFGESTGYDYSREVNPTREQLENIVASLENGKRAIAFSSGMAAISCLMELFSPGDHIITDSDLYGGSMRLFDSVNSKNGIEFTHIDCSEDDIESFVKENTKAIYIETPTNPMMHVTDIRKTAEIARRHDLLLIVDNTFLTPYYQKPLEFGADIVVHSGTKFLGGHHDTLAGFLVTSNEEIAEKLFYLQVSIGSQLAPFDSWLIIRGIQTLPIRMDKSQENAEKIADFLLGEKSIVNVYYPGLKGTKAYEVNSRQASGSGSMITFEAESRELALHIINETKLIPFAESLGGTSSLITYPITQTHADVPEDILKKNGLNDRILRLSAGIEDADDLISDLKQAIRSFNGK
jgi:cystathionine gamma-synthase